jgi:hypothetical protein
MGTFGATSPATLQLNVPAQAMEAYTHDFVEQFPHLHRARLALHASVEFSFSKPIPRPCTASEYSAPDAASGNVSIAFLNQSQKNDIFVIKASNQWNYGRYSAHFALVGTISCFRISQTFPLEGKASTCR